MNKHSRSVIALFLLLALAGCSGNYKSSDKDYRPLGKPAAEVLPDEAKHSMTSSPIKQ
jgi:hypothetical protein